MKPPPETANFRAGSRGSRPGAAVPSGMTDSAGPRHGQPQAADLRRVCPVIRTLAPNGGSVRDVELALCRHLTRNKARELIRKAKANAPNPGPHR